jgi:hypothetical protein
MSESLLRTDLLTAELLENPEKIKVIAQEQFTNIVNTAITYPKLKTNGSAKDIIEVMELIRQAILDYEERTHTTEDAKINVIFEEPDTHIDIETISISFFDRIPGAFSQGKPMEGNVKNRKPILREIVDDPDNPGYKRAVLGYYYDNILRLTAWARTNKQANQRAIWIENFMEEYSWFFAFSGVNRILFDGWRQHKTIEINNNKYYGRPIDFFVRTEKLWNISQKNLEEIIVKLGFST